MIWSSLYGCRYGCRYLNTVIALIFERQHPNTSPRYSYITDHQITDLRPPKLKDPRETTLNYLAHFHLSHGNNDLLVGALLGDFIKGPLTGKYSKQLEQGIMLHRKIDAFTDSHPNLRLAQQRFKPHYRRFAGIMTDVVFDHFLTRHWQQFHPQPLSDFSQDIYHLLAQSQLPSAARRLADNLTRYDVFVNYQHWQTVEAALAKIGQRIQRSNPLATAATELQQHSDELEQAFLNFYPQLQHHVNEIRQGFNS